MDDKARTKSYRCRASVPQGSQQCYCRIVVLNIEAAGFWREVGSDP